MAPTPSQSPQAVLADSSATERLPSERLPSERSSRIILSFDVEEHFRIEAAAELVINRKQLVHYGARLEASTSWLLDELERRNLHATFFVVGQIAHSHPALIKRMADAQHEVASHSWDHKRVYHHTPASFREDVRKSREALEQLTGRPVAGFRAPTFSIVRETAWALDVLAELGFAYDSSIYPIRHDRYGVPQAPRTPFRARGSAFDILELPPATLRVLGLNIPVGGGGYFRLLPSFLLRQALSRSEGEGNPSVTTLYFHPWEFDSRQARLPLGALSRFRTYAGIARSRPRLLSLLDGYVFSRAIDVAKELDRRWETLPKFALSDGGRVVDVAEASGAAAPLRLPAAAWLQKAA